MPSADRRRGKLLKLAKKEHVDALLVTNFTNVTYLTGFTGDDSYLLLTRDKAIVLSDSRYTTQLEEECPDVELAIRGTGTKMNEHVEKVVGKLKLSQLGIEASSMSVAQHETLSDKLAGVELVSTTGLVEQLRQTKDKQEIDKLRLAVHHGERAFAAIKAMLRGDQTEKQVAAEIENQIRLFGGTGCSFPPIVAVGPRAALPHATPTDGRIDGEDFVLIDWGAESEGYMSDFTRVLLTGKSSAKFEKIYSVVLKAQKAAIEAIKPGMKLKDLDAVARKVITDAGYGKQFGHGLGHGLGLEIHEAPRLSKTEEAELKAGMVVTIEPGIYFPGWGGVRIEDDVLVTRNGHEELSSVPKELDDCAVVI